MLSIDSIELVSGKHKHENASWDEIKEELSRVFELILHSENLLLIIQNKLQKEFQSPLNYMLDM